ncbi:hypothetical protein B0H11DRAFT_1701638 [Mycena galericulata]|nr:hypothetical protein B0H11DRAFT_1701638 [Mycena galericulata]
MLALTCFFVLALASASKLNIRQTTNTNAAINSIVDTLDEDLRHVGPTICTDQVYHTASDTTIGQQISNLEAAFSKATQRLSSTPAGAGSTTVSPTNDEIRNTFSDAIQ